jgi:hypothetical protein
MRNEMLNTVITGLIRLFIDDLNNIVKSSFSDKISYYFYINYKIDTNMIVDTIFKKILEKYDNKNNT